MNLSPTFQISPHADSVIEVRSVRKAFKTVQAVDGIDLNIRQGEFLALLGPNGAGKTTLVEMIEGIQKPDQGKILILGRTWHGNEEYLHRRIGLALQETRFVEKLTVRETLRLFASFYGVGAERVEATLNMVSLQEKSEDRVGNLSGGQRQRLSLGLALLHEPTILLLDEPTTGLDPNARREVWSVILDLKKTGRITMILTTHYMEEAERICDRIVILDHGRILKQGGLDELLGEVRPEAARSRDCRDRTLDDLFTQLTGRKLDE